MFLPYMNSKGQTNKSFQILQECIITNLFPKLNSVNDIKICRENDLKPFLETKTMIVKIIIIFALHAMQEFLVFQNIDNIILLQLAQKIITEKAYNFSMNFLLLLNKFCNFAVSIIDLYKKFYLRFVRFHGRSQILNVIFDCCLHFVRCCKGLLFTATQSIIYFENVLDDNG